MNKFLLLLLAFSPLQTKELEKKDHYTFGAMHCMKILECTKDVHEMTTENKTDEERKLIATLKLLNIKVYKAAPIYFTDTYRALYYPDTNSIFINARYWEDQLVLLRHEAWHVAQDCKVGLHNSDLVPIHHHEDVPIEFKKDAIKRYGTGDPFVHKIEREALWAGDTPWMSYKEISNCLNK